MRRQTRYSDAIYTHLDSLIAKTPPYSLSSPTYGNTTLLDFVKGLIISTNVIEVINEYLNNGYHADWGQIIEKNGNLMSNESDIIIYRGPPGCKLIKNPSMRFAVVEKDQVKLVIQVKSCIDTVRPSDQTYCKELLKFSPEVWYLAECCWANNKTKIKKLEKKIRAVGYSEFIYFYTRDESSKMSAPNYLGFEKFIDSIKRISRGKNAK